MRMSDVAKKELCERAIGVLQEDEQKIIRLAYGFETGGQWTDDMISEEMDMPRSTVQWKRDKAIRTMRGELGARA